MPQHYLALLPAQAQHAELMTKPPALHRVRNDQEHLHLEGSSADDTQRFDLLSQSALGMHAIMPSLAS